MGLGRVVRLNVRGAARILGLALAVGSAAGHAELEREAEVFAGIVTRVSDGDTLWVRPDSAPARRPVKVRLVGLDAPERCQLHGTEATEALARRVLHRRVEVRRRATDEHGRALGSLWLDGQDVGAQLVRDGHAWSARWRGDLGPYAVQEREARAARRGLFAYAAPQFPRDFRREHGPCS